MCEVDMRGLDRGCMSALHRAGRRLAEEAHLEV